MCNSKDDGEIEMVVRMARDRQDQLCVKNCGQTAVLVTRVNDAFCRECFLAYVTSKFRKEIGKTRLVTDRQRVLVAFSGGPASSCLLHMIQEGLSERTRKRLRFVPSFIYIDEAGVVDWDVQEAQDAWRMVLEKLRNSGFPAFTSFLFQSLELGQGDEAVYRAVEESYTALPGQQAGVDRLRHVLASLGSVTAKEEFVRIARLRLLGEIARQSGCSLVMLADSSLRIAVRILADLARGRGAQIAADAAFADERNPDVKFLKPLRSVTSKEVAWYNQLQGVCPVLFPSLTTKAMGCASIDHQTEAFVAGLQANFVTTVSNICSTGSKMQQAGRVAEEDCCAFCKSPLDTSVGLASALTATELSAQLSETCATDSQQGSGLASEEAEQLKQSLCYGCRLLLKEMKEVNGFPPSVQAQARRRVSRAEVRAQIQSMLLGDSDSETEQSHDGGDEDEDKENNTEGRA